MKTNHYKNITLVKEGLSDYIDEYEYIHRRLFETEKTAQQRLDRSFLFSCIDLLEEYVINRKFCLENTDFYISDDGYHDLRPFNPPSNLLVACDSLYSFFLLLLPHSERLFEEIDIEPFIAFSAFSFLANTYFKIDFALNLNTSRINNNTAPTIFTAAELQIAAAMSDETFKKEQIDRQRAQSLSPLASQAISFPADRKAEHDINLIRSGTYSKGARSYYRHDTATKWLSSKKNFKHTRFYASSGNIHLPPYWNNSVILEKLPRNRTISPISNLDLFPEGLYHKLKTGTFHLGLYQAYWLDQFLSHSSSADKTNAPRLPFSVL